MQRESETAMDEQAKACGEGEVVDRWVSGEGVAWEQVWVRSPHAPLLHLVWRTVTTTTRCDMGSGIVFQVRNVDKRWAVDPAYVCETKAIAGEAARSE
jgi:hypothetical protein